MKLLALSDLHLGFPDNRAALENLPAYPEDWLILAGDVCETQKTLKYAFESLTPKFRQLIWVPGNHELWTLPRHEETLRGEYKYRSLIDLCRQFKVITPEDPYPNWTCEDKSYILAPLFLLYDYSFRPDEIPEGEAIEWAMSEGILCTDESLLHPDPYPSRQAWCESRCNYTFRRLEQAASASPESSFILINHFPLRRDLALTPRVPRFSIWCGTRKTEHWHTHFNVSAVVSGHLHIRRTAYRDGVRFEEVSLGYPHQWKSKNWSPTQFVKQIIPEESSD